MELFLSFWVVFLVCVSILKVAVMFVGGDESPDLTLPNYTYGDAPLYTVLVPMFMEKVVDMNQIRKNLQNIQYPSVEIIYLCEEIDTLASVYFRASRLCENEKVVFVPRIPPFTKPKACNYGLEFAKGRFVTIYDVEDVPHPMQLAVALDCFQTTSVDCIQFPLEFVHDGTLLSAWQVIDYVVWYRCILPFLQKIGAPIPLGGTSNHFRVSKLREVGGWDGYNVTEDAELGVRMFFKNFNVQYINCFETKERTIPNIVNLVNQRSRWVKGHFLTALSFTKFAIPNGSGGFVCRVLGYVRNLFWIWFVLGFNVIMYVSYISITLGFGLVYNDFTLVFMVFGLMLFFLVPFLYLISIRRLRSGGLITAVLLFNFYTIFYLIPVVVALFGCVFQPSYWYKTKR